MTPPQLFLLPVFGIDRPDDGTGTVTILPGFTPVEDND
jgi:hypothetical protein